MTQSYEEYLKHVAEHGETFSPPKKKTQNNTFKLCGKNGNTILLKNDIDLNYGCTEDNSIIYIEDDTNNKQLTNDLNTKKFKLHLSNNILYIDFNTDYYYTLIEFDTFNQYKYCETEKKLTIALLSDNKSDIINKWTIDVNLL